MFKRIHTLEDGQVPGGKDWRIEGKEDARHQEAVPKADGIISFFIS